MEHTGIDMAYAPTQPAQLASLLRAVGGDFALAYIGGRRNGGHGWSPAYVKEAAAAGVAQWLPCYVGAQVVPSLNLNDVGLLSATQGYLDGEDAAACMRAYGWTERCLCFLDVEYDTAALFTEQAVAYCDGWCKGLRAAGYQAGVYGPLAFLTRLWSETNRPDAIYAADWVAGGLVSTLDPAALPGLPGSVAAGYRVWQYAGNATALGVAVDLDVANMPLNPAPGLPFRPPAPRPPAHTAADYAAAHWVAALDGLVSGVPIAGCASRKAQVRAWVEAHP